MINLWSLLRPSAHNHQYDPAFKILLKQSEILNRLLFPLNNSYTFSVCRAEHTYNSASTLLITKLIMN